MDFFKDIKPLTKIGERNLENPSVKPVEEKKGDITEPVHKRQEPPFIPLDDDISPQDTQTNLGHKGIWVFAIIAIIVLFVVVSTRLSSAHITITLKPKNTAISETIQLTENKVGTLPFETIEVSTEIQKELTLTKQETKKEKATGEILISNLYSQTPQTLVKQTRFETKEGLIFRLIDTVSVPGFTQEGSDKTAGTITVPVIADTVGEQYNIGADTFFTIPGFKGSPQFETISAQSTSQFKNGLDGTYYTLDTSAVSPIDDTQALKEKLKELVKKQIPQEDFITLPGLYEITTNQNGSFYSKEPKSSTVVTGTLKQIVFPKKTFFSYIQSKYPEIDTESHIDVSTLDGVIVSSIPSEKSYTVQLTGVIKSYKNIDENMFKEKLVGKKKNAFNTILSENFSENIENAELRIRPIWINKIPETFNRIKIKYTDVK